MRKFALCLLLLCTSPALARAPEADDPRETARIQRWLSHVEAFLRSRDVTHLSRAQRERRELNLQHLHAYWRAGRFPHNHHTAGLSPVFIDEHGTACAVGHLLLTGGAEALARRIAREHLLARLPELHSPALARWATANGFTLEELALIQPSYNTPPPEQRVCLRRVPTVLRYGQGWEAVPGPLDSGELRDGWELPWLGVSQEGLLTLTSRAGRVYTWGGITFQSRMGEPARVTAALPLTRKTALLAILPGPGPGNRAAFLRTQEADRRRFDEYDRMLPPQEDTFEHGPRPELYSLWAEQGVGTVFGVGRHGVIVRRTPYESWVALESPSKAPLLDIDGTGAKDLWAVGGGGTVLHFDGAQWRPVDSGTREGLVAVAAAAPDNVWAVGTRGTALHFDGTRWQRVDTGVSSTLRAVAITQDGPVLGGDEGVLLHRSGDQWIRQDVPTPDSIMSLAFAEDTLFATTNAQVPCSPYLRVMAERWFERSHELIMDSGLVGYTVPRVNWPLLQLGRVQARIHQLTGIHLPITLSLLVLLGVPLALCVRARRQDSELEWPVAVGTVLALLLAGLVFITARDGASYEFTLMQGAGDASMRNAELTRLQDWVLLEYDLRRPSLGSESQPAATASWSTPASFIQNAGESGNARDNELRARYRRLLSTGDADPLVSLAGTSWE
jgi:hypothetical protein